MRCWVWWAWPGGLCASHYIIGGIQGDRFAEWRPDIAVESGW